MNRARIRFRDAAGRTTDLLRRRWYVVAAVLLCFLPFMYHAWEAKGVYYAKFDMVFLPPASAAGGNPLRTDSLDIVHFAAVVERTVNASGQLSAIQTSGAPLYGTGIRDGVSVYLPNSGGQWQASFNRPAITVEIAQETPEAVLAEAAGIRAHIAGASNEMQADMGVIPEAFITPYASPATVSATYIGVHNSRALVALAVLGLCLALAAARASDSVLDRLARRRGRATSAAGEIVQPRLLLSRSQAADRPGEGRRSRAAATKPE